MTTLFPSNLFLKYAAKIDLISGYTAGKAGKKNDEDAFFDFSDGSALPNIKPNLMGAPSEETAPTTGVKKAPSITQDKPPSINEMFARWQKDQHPNTMNNMLMAVQPTIDAAIRSYGEPDNPLIKSKAKLLAINAIKSYDPKNKANLNSWIALNLQGLQRYRNDLAPIPVPERIRLDNFRLQRERDTVFNELGREPTDDELSERTGLSPKRIQYVKKMSRPVANEGQYGEEDEESGKYMPGVDTQEWQNIWLEYVYHDLDPIDRKIFDMRMNRGDYKDKTMSVNDIAKDLGVSPSAVSQRSNKIAEKLLQMYELENKV